LGGYHESGSAEIVIFACSQLDIKNIEKIANPMGEFKNFNT